MAASPNVGAQLKDMLKDQERYKKITASAGPQCTDLSFMTLLWPLLPLLPPEPPALFNDLLREAKKDKCDLCGTSQGTPLKTYTGTSTGGIEPVDTTDSSLRLRRVSDWKTPLDRLMKDIDNKMDETLKSIQETTENDTKLYKKAKEIEESQMSDMTDAELLKTLKKLTKVKADRMEKVKVLEEKEQQLKESLTNTIKWARSVELNKDIPENIQVSLEDIVSEKDILPKDEESLRSR